MLSRPRELQTLEWGQTLEEIRRVIFYPGSRLLTSSENMARHKRLELEVDARGHTSFAGVGIAADSEWPPEKSLLILDMSRPEAIEIGQHYGQNAVVCRRVGKCAMNSGRGSRAPSNRNADQERNRVRTLSAMDDSKQLREILSWRLVSELWRRFPDRFMLLETHPGGGRYDGLTLWDRAGNSGSLVDVNRQGSVHVRPATSAMRSWPNWARRMLSDAPVRFLDELTCVLEPDQRAPASRAP